jgi:uncharacterized protein YegP (UPF0339 family)
MKFHIYKDSRQEYRWKLKAANGAIIADSGEGYSSKQACKFGIALVQRSNSADVQDDTGERS